MESSWTSALLGEKASNGNTTNWIFKTLSFSMNNDGYMLNWMSGLELREILLALLILVIVSFVWKRNVRNRKLKLRKLPHYLPLPQIMKATKEFNQGSMISETEDAQVYQGFIPSYGQVAFKRFSQESHIADQLYERELSGWLTGLSHNNIIKLIGWCEEKNELILAYEFMSNGSLDMILNNSSNILTWERRVNIILGVASALTYLHHGGLSAVIHGDVKISSIMIDSDFNAKLRHFGQAVFRNKKPGTVEGQTPGVPTVKKDVEDFGLVVLQVATGRNDNIELIQWVWDLWMRGKLLDAADHRLGGGHDENGEMDRMLKAGLWCVHPNPTERPNVREAVEMILGERTIPLLPPWRPTVSTKAVYQQN